jgi:hypothetical protein
MKATLEFNLPDEQHEFYCATKGQDMIGVLWEMQSELRKLWKYEELNEDQFNMVERIRETFFNSLQEHEINLDK